jgi:starch phosphorylase
MKTRTAPVPAATVPAQPDIRTGNDADAIARSVVDNLRCLQGKLPHHATRHDWYTALAHSTRDRLFARCLSTVETVIENSASVKLVAYLSAEFLTGPHLGNAMVNLGIRTAAEQAMGQLGQDLSVLLEEEEEPGLGNGGLGRLAACYMDSLATLNVPAIGYGIRYEFGIFDQAIRDGWQVELTDKWLRFGNPWEIVRSDVAYEVAFGGRTEQYHDGDGRFRVRWRPARMVKGIAYDTPVPGYQVPTTNVLRLWKAEAIESFDFDEFNVGNYYGAVDEKIASETISKVLYPNDEPEIGKRLRLAQQHFFVSCSLQDMIRIHLMRGKRLDEFDSFWAAQLNDTHPALAVAELMRLLVDEHLMEWDAAWTLTQRTCAYTNHTLLPEALERWPVALFASMLPRHFEIVCEINRRFLAGLSPLDGADQDLVRRLSLIDETGGRYVRMAHLAAVGSHTINGVAALHSTLLTRTVLRDFYRVMPQKFRNVTNGVTPRRFLVLSNPALTSVMTRRIGARWVSALEHELARLEPLATDAGFQEEWSTAKAANKQALAALVRERTGITIDPQSLFDVQVKRLHEYKRQHLNVLHVVTLYDRLRRGGVTAAPRTVIFGGKAAPGYVMAKLIIKLINSVAAVVNGDASVRDALKVVFLPDFNVKNGQCVYPAADLSEQISTAGKEASGTGNMKFSLNGALTIGTLDGANVEIRDAVGDENFFLFGLTAEEVEARRASGYRPRDVYEANAALREAIDLIAGGFFSGGDRDIFRPLVESLLTADPYMLLADYEPYVEAQSHVAAAYVQRQTWTRMSILNASRAGMFSSDRAIREYCRDIWKVGPVPVKPS